MYIWKFLKVRFMDFQYIETVMWKFLLKKRIKLVNNVLFLENIEGYVFRIFHGLLLFGRLLLFVFDKIPSAMLIWGATTIWQVRVVTVGIGNLQVWHRHRCHMKGQTNLKVDIVIQIKIKQLIFPRFKIKLTLLQTLRAISLPLK